MSHKTIRSKWHLWLDAYKNGHIMVSMGNNVYRTPNRLRHWQKEKLDEYLFIGNGELKEIPRYVFSQETHSIINSRETMETIEILKKFGRYHLPHPVCMAEYEHQNSGIRVFSFVYEKKDRCVLDKESFSFPFFVNMVALYDFSHPEMAKSLKHRDATLRAQQFAVIYPIIADMENIPGSAFDDAADIEGRGIDVGGIRYQSLPVPWLAVSLMENTAETPFDKEDMIKEYVVRAGFAVRALTSLMQTQGVIKEAVTQADVNKLNKKRVQSGATAIAEHTYITLSRTSSKTGAKGVVPTGRKMRFHMRAAHSKMQRYGPQNSLSKEIMVDAYLVNADQGGELRNLPKIVRA